MARRSITVAIDDERYELTMLGATEGLSVYNRLLKTLGPVVRGIIADPGIIAAQKKDPTAVETDEGLGLRVAGVIFQGFEAMPVEFTLELAALFAHNSKVVKAGVMLPLDAGDIFDQHFAGRYAHMTRWLIEHLKLNFSDFLARAASSGAAARVE
jgi:hypothetical protein